MQGQASDAQTGPHVRVTLEQIYVSVLEVKELFAQVGPDVKQQGEEIDDHEVRLRALEKMVWRATGVSAILSALLTGLVLEIFKGSM